MLRQKGSFYDYTLKKALKVALSNLGKWGILEEIEKVNQQR